MIAVKAISDSLESGVLCARKQDKLPRAPPSARHHVVNPSTTCRAGKLDSRRVLAFGTNRVGHWAPPTGYREINHGQWEWWTR